MGVEIYLHTLSESPLVSISLGEFLRGTPRFMTTSDYTTSHLDREISSFLG
jgi:hypothetical protein